MWLFIQKAQDRWVGFWERRRGVAYRPSPMAWKEALAYYEGLYQDRGPDPLAFRRLLVRRGTPDWKNPFPEGMVEHYRYHPEGLMLADVEAILGEVLNAWKPPPVSPELPLGVELGEWPTLEQATQLRLEEQIKEERSWGHLACVCWGFALLNGEPLRETISKIHADNLTWATVHAWRHVDWSAWGVSGEQVLRAASGLGILSIAMTEELLKTSSFPVGYSAATSP